MAAESTKDEFYEGIQRLADKYGLKDDEREHFIDQHMTRAGYKTVKSYVPGEDSGKEGKSSGPGWFK